MVLLLLWLLPGSAGRPDLSDQKGPQRLGNLAEVASETPTSFRSRGIPVTSPDFESDPGDDVVAQVVPRDSGRHRSHREESVACGDDRVDRRSVTRDAVRALAGEILRGRSSAERHAEVAYRCADALDDLKCIVRRLPRLEDYRALSERLQAVEQANASLHATVRRFAPLEMEVVALRAQKQLLVQSLGGRRPKDSFWRQRFRVHMRRIPVRLEQAHEKHRVGAHPFGKV
ncbi:uncharacterized protein PHALS_10438 [Plasmopara halstedii]|uniref:Uncharacterized protein n=1 Tax=Plasmopara halstedii TaxID=4781 RepID=A0A0P1AHC0_PLAHL|nr:uncharacterized protein PHALS_10438 [Plasmopara halstedii]CEG40226.1 hypothetical protein PHALS_10438 [Plasmopara halstedii]|eukprot:XP_024576595.1 hypothetical protein PHALS_10438 [Plasmopara halstedii]